MRPAIRRLAGLLILLAVASSLTACVRQRQYRYVNIPLHSDKLLAIEDHQKEGYKLAFIEFKDNGDPHDPQQAIKAEELIRTERKAADGSWAESSVVLIYVHGWKNNANEASAPKRKDVEKFKETLKEIAPLLPALPDGRPTPLIGVYIGWRGKSLELPDALNWVSFWTRGLAAKRVGGDDLTKTLNKLVAISKRKDDQKIRPKVVIVGHSFGSRVLEQAENRRSIQKGDCKQLHVKGEPIRPQVDLVLFVNAATGSRVTREIIEECTPKEGSDPKRVFVRHPDFDEKLCPLGAETESAICRPYPMFVSISSRSDYATKLLLPLAAFRLSAAHTSLLNTHRVIELKGDQEVPEGNIFTFRTRYHDGEHFYAVVPKERERGRQFWIMTVDKNVIASHGDIWNEDFRIMLIRMMGEMQVVQMKAEAYNHLAPKAKAREIK